MMRRIVSMLAATVLVLPTAVSAQTAQARADQALARHAQGDAPGAVVVVIRDGKTVYRSARGMASLEQSTPLTPTTILDIGSVAKQFTAFAIALLESQGKLSLNDDIRKYLPEIRDLGKPITIRNLLNHTSGLREIYNTMTIGGWQAGDGMTQEQAIRLVAAQPALQFAPGSEHVYNNTGYMLLTDIVERVTGQEWHVWMQNNVFRPLGMNSTVIMHRLGQVIPGAADSYARTGTEWTRVFDNSTIQGAGGIYSNSDDMSRWVAQWHKPVVGTRVVLDRMQERAVLTSGDTIPYALGLRVGRTRGLRTVEHGGSSAGYRTALLQYPELAGAVIVQSNLASLNTGRLAAELSDIFFGDRLGPATAEAPASAAAGAPAASDWKPAASELAAYSGRYYSSEVEALYQLSMKGDSLVMRHHRIGEQRLQPRARDLFNVGGGIGEIRFERDGNRITGFTVSNGRTRGVRFEVMR